MKFSFGALRKPELTPIGGLVTPQLVNDINHNFSTLFDSFAVVSERIAKLETREPPISYWMDVERGPIPYSQHLQEGWSKRSDWCNAHTGNGIDPELPYAFWLGADGANAA